MPLQRSSLDQQSFSNVLGKEFIIEPEYLKTEEIKHELRIRNESAGGDRRTLSARLRSCLAEERKEPGARAMYFYGNPGDEFQYCNENTGRLRGLLEQITPDPITHERFMSLFLHLEARLNRIPQVVNALNLSEAIFYRNEEYSGLYNEFVEKIKTMLNRVRRAVGTANIPIITDNVGPIPPNDHNAQTVAPSTSSPSNIPPVNNPSTSQAPSSEPIIQVNGHNTFGINTSSSMGGPRPVIHDNTGGIHTSVSNGSDGMALLRQLLGNNLQIPINANGTMNLGDNARLSQQFQHSNGQLLTPIPPLPTQNTLNTNAHQNSLNLGGWTNDNDGLLQIHIPPPSFGDGRINSWPNNFGANVPQVNMGGTNTPQTNRGAPIFPQTSRNNLSYANNIDGIRVNPMMNGGGIGTPLTNNGVPTAPQTNGGEASHAEANDGIRVYPSMNGNGGGNTQEIAGDTGTANGIGGSGPNVMGTNRAPNNDMARSTNANSTQGVQMRQPVTGTEEKLNFIVTALASLADEVARMRQERNSHQEIHTSGQYDPFGSASGQNIMPNPNSHTNDNRYSSNFIPIHKWNWKFSADKSSDVPERRDLVAFLKKLELYRQAENLSYEQIHRKFHFLIDGCVYEWYMQYRHNFANWNQLLEGLKKQFTTPLTHFMKVAKLAARRQRKEETAMTYIASIQREFDELGMYSEREKISIIQNGLNDRLRNVALSHDWVTVQDMDLHLRTIEVADELRKETESQVQKRLFFPRRAINTVDVDSPSELEGVGDNFGDEYGLESDEQSEVNCQAIRAKAPFRPNPKRGYMTKSAEEQNSNKEKITTLTDTKDTQTRKTACYNCQSELHRLMDCEEPITRIFCFRCGREGVRALNCTCNPKNSKGVACSTTEPCDQ